MLRPIHFATEFIPFTNLFLSSPPIPQPTFLLCSYEFDLKKNFIYLEGCQNNKIYKILCIYSYMLTLQSPSKYSPFHAIHLLRYFSHCSKQFLNSLILMPFSASAVFCFTLPLSAKHFLLRTFLSKKTKK